MTHVETYEQAIEYLFSRINYERVSGATFSAADFRLDRMRALLDRIGNPHEKIPAVHVAGTKGKGSTAAMISSVLSAAGYRTGLFTSPHISVFEERMAVDGERPSPMRIVELVNAIREPVAALDKTPGSMSPTYFEIATAMSWLFFQQQQAEVAVLEVGLGGRLDATNLCRPAATVITTISRDHTRQLGSRLAQIAREKAGILKPGVPLISGVTAPEALAAIAAECEQRGVPRYQLGVDFEYRYHPGRSYPGRSDQVRSCGAGENRPGASDDCADTVDVLTSGRNWTGLRSAMIGEHQAHNMGLAVATIERLIERGWTISEAAVRRGLERVRWPGRIEVLGGRPTVVIDAAHNWAAVTALLKTLDVSFSARRRVLVFAATRDKDVCGMLRQLLPRFDAVILTSYQNNPRSVSTEELMRMVQSLSDVPVHSAAETVAAWKLAQRIATPADLICVTGSFFIAAELRELILDDVRNLEARTSCPMPARENSDA